MLFWGEKDQSVPFRGGLGINSVEEFVNPPVSMTVKFMADLYGCARPPKLTFENKTATDNATCYTYTECARAPSTNDLFSYCVRSLVKLSSALCCSLTSPSLLQLPMYIALSARGEKGDKCAR